MENKEIKNKRITGETMKLKEKVIGYFQTYWKKNIFTKSVSVLVAACFILNIFNLPAFADPTYEMMKKQKESIHGVYVGSKDNSVSNAHNREKSVLVHDGVIYEKKDMSSGHSEHAELEKRINEGTISESELNNRLKEYNPVGNWNGKEATNVSQMSGVSPQEYKRIIEGKLAASAVTDAASSEDETSVGFFAGTIEKVKDFVTGSNKGSEEEQKKEESVVESKVSGEEQKEESVTDDKVNKEEGLTEPAAQDENIMESEKASDDKYEYDQGMLEDLANKTGKTTDEIVKMSEEARKDSHATDLEQGIEQGTTFDNAMSVLKDFLANGGQVVNCAAEALSTVLNMTNKGLLGFQAILADISAGLFTKDKIDGDQVLTSASALQSVMKLNGREDAMGYGLGIEEFMSGLGEGESGILWVDGDHFITVSKDEEGNFSVTDPNRNNGKAEVYSASEFEKLLSGEEAETVEGKKTEGYQLERDAEGNVLVKTVTDSYGVKEAAGPEGVLTEDEMEQITGAKLVPQTVMVTKTGTKTETRTGTRTETRTGTRTYTDEDGEEHTEEYEYDVEVEYQYEVEVEFTYQEEETVMVEVPDDDEDIEEEQRKEQEEAARAAAIAEQEAKNRELEQKVAEENLRREQEAAEKARETGEGIIEGSEKVIPEEEEEARKEEIEKEAQERESALQQSIEETKEKTEVAQSNNIIKQAELEVVNAKISLDLAKKGEETKEKADIVKSLELSLTNSMDALGVALEQGKEVLSGIANGELAVNFATTLTNTAIEVLGIVESTVVDGVQALRDTALSFIGGGNGKPGVHIDEKNNTITTYGTDGKIDSTMTLSENTNYDEMRKIIEEQGYQVGLNYAKQTGLLLTETKYDDKGKEIYTAENIGYNNGTMALLYDFKQDYSNETTIVGAKADESKVVVEEYNGAGSNYSLSRAMTYSVEDDKKTQDIGSGTMVSRKIGEEYTTVSGVTFTAAIGELERVTEFSNKTIKGDTYRVANTVEFKDGDPTAFEEAVMIGEHVNVTRYDLTDALSQTKLERPQGSGSGSNEPTIVDQYEKILSLTSGLKLKGNNELYSGYSKVSNDYIDTSKIQTYSYSTATPNTLTTNYTRANGEENVTVSVKIDNPNEWRTNPQISSDKTENVATITSKLGDGGVRVETYYGVDVSGKDLKINNEDLFGLSYEWYDADAKGNVVRGEVEFQSGSTVVLKGSEDRVRLAKGVSFTYEVQADGSYAISGDATVSGIYSNYHNGEFVGSGVLENCKYEISSNGIPLLTGKVNINEGSEFFVGKRSGGDEKDEPKPDKKEHIDASDTKAVVIESDEGYRVSDGSISLRSGGLVVLGDGAVFNTGSSLNGIGKVTEGQLKVGIDEEGNFKFTANSGTCKVMSVSENGETETHTRYDTEGIVRIYNVNKKTGATLLEEYKHYDEETGKTSPILDANGNQSVRLTLTANKTGDTGFGYYVDTLGGHKNVSLIISADGTATLNSGARIFKYMFVNDEAGEKIGVLYSGNTDGTASFKYQFRGKMERYDLATEDNNIFYGIDRKGNVMELLVNDDKKSFTSKDITADFEKNTEEEKTTYTRNNNDGITKSQTILAQIDNRLIVNTVIKEINTPEFGWQAVDTVMYLPGLTADDKLVNIKTTAGGNLLYSLTQNGWTTGDSIRIGEYQISKTEDGGWTARNVHGKDNAIYNLHDINGHVSFEIAQLREEGKDIWHTVDKTLTVPDGSGQLVSARILDEEGNYKYDAYFTLGADGSWVTSDKELKVGNYTAKKDSKEQWTLGGNNVIYNLNVVNEQFSLSYSKIYHDGNWLGVNDVVTVPDGSGGVIVNAGVNNTFFTLDDVTGKWITGDVMTIGKYTAQKQTDGSLLLYDSDTKYKVSLVDKQIQMDMMQIYDKQRDQWNIVNCTTYAPDGSGIVVSAQINDADGNYLYDAYYTLDENNKWITSHKLQVGNYTLSKESGRWLFNNDNMKFLLSTSVDADGKKMFNTTFDSFKLHSDNTWYTGHEIQQLPGGGTLILGRIDDDFADRHYSFYCTTDENGNIVQIADGMKVGEFTIGKDDTGWYMSNPNGSSILNTNGMSGELSGKFRLGHSVQMDEFGSVISGSFTIKTTQDQNIKYVNPNGTISNIILNSGAEVIMQNNGMFIMNGIATIPNDGTKIKIPAKPKGEPNSGGPIPDGTGTNAYIQGHYDGSFTVSNGTLKISNGDFVVEGLGAIAKAGSTFIIGNTTITARGNLTYKEKGWYGAYKVGSFDSTVNKYRRQIARNLGVDTSKVYCSASNRFYGYINNYSAAMNNAISRSGFNVYVKEGDSLQGARIESLKDGAYLHYSLQSGTLSVRGGSSSSITFARDCSDYNYYTLGRSESVGTIRSTFNQGDIVDVSLATMLGGWMKSNNVEYVSLSANPYEKGFTVAGYTAVARYADPTNPYSTGGYIGFKYDATTGKAVTTNEMYISSFGETLFTDADGNKIKSAAIIAGSEIRDIGPNGEVTFDSANIRVNDYEGSSAIPASTGSPDDEKMESIITDPSVSAYFDGTADVTIRKNKDGSVYYDEDNKYYVDVKGSGVFYGCTIGDNGVISGMSASTVAFSSNSTLHTGSTLELLVNGQIQKGEVLDGAIINDRNMGWTTAYKDVNGKWVPGYDENGKTGKFQWNTDLSGFFIENYFPGFDFKDPVDFTGIQVEGAIFAGTSLVDGYLNTNKKSALPIVANKPATVLTPDGTSEVSSGTIINVNTAEANGTRVFHTTYGGNVNDGESQVIYKLMDGATFDGYDSEKGIVKNYSDADIGTEISVLAAIGPNVDIKTIYPGVHLSPNSSGELSTTENLDVTFRVKVDENGHAWLSNKESFNILFDNGSGAGEQTYTVEKNSIVQLGAVDTEKGKAMKISLVDAAIRMLNVNYGPSGADDGDKDSNDASNDNKGLVAKGEGSGVYYIDADNNIIASGIINNTSSATLASDLSKNNIQTNFYATDQVTAAFFNKAFESNTYGLYIDGKINLNFSYSESITEETESNGLVLNNVTVKHGFTWDEDKAALGSSQILTRASENALAGTVDQNGNRQLLDSATINGLVNTQIDAASVNQAYAMQEYTKNIHVEAENVFGSSNVKRAGNNITVNGHTYDITNEAQMQELRNVILNEKAQNLGEEAAELLGSNAVTVRGYTIEMNGQVYDVRSEEDIEVFNKNLGLYREAYAEQVTDIVTDVYGDEAKVTGTKVTVNGQTYDMTKTEDIQSLQAVANTKNIADQVVGVFGSENVKVDGIYLVVDGIKYNTTSEAELAKLNTALNEQNAYNILSQQLNSGESIARDTNGNMVIVQDSAILNYAGEGLFNLAHNDHEVTIDGVTKFIDEGSMKTVDIDNGIITVTSDTRGFLNFGGSVNVTEYILDGNGGVTKVDMSASKTLWFINTGTNTEVTKYSDTTMQNGISTSYNNENNGFWDWADSKCGNLLDYKNGTLEGSFHLNKDTELSARTFEVKSALNNPFNLDAGTYYGSEITIGNGKNATLVETVRDANVTPDGLPTANNGNVVGAAVSQVDIKASGEALMNLKESDGKIPFHVNSFTNRNQVVYDQFGFIRSIENLSGESYIDNTNKIQAASLVGTLNDLQLGTVTDTTYDLKLSSYNQARMDDLSDLGKGECKILPGSGIEGDYNGHSLNDLYVFQDKGFLGFSETITMTDGKGFELKQTDVFKTPDIKDHSVGVGGTTDSIRFEIEGDVVKISLSEQTKTRDAYTTHEGGYIPATYKIQETLQATISYGKDGSVTNASSEVIRDENGNLTNQLRQKTQTTTLFGEQTIKDLTAIYNPAGGYDKDLFINPESLTDISGYSVIIDRSGKATELTMISGDLTDLVWNNNQMVQSNMVNYKETLYAPKKDNVDGPALESGIAIPGVGDPSDWVKQSTTVQNGMVYTVHSDADLKYIPAEYKAYIDMEDKIDQEGNVTGKQLSSAIESVTINDGVTKDVYKPTLNADGQYEDVLSSREVVTSVEQIGKTKYSTDGINFVGVNSVKDGSNVVASQSIKKVSMSTVVETLIEDGQPVIDKTTGEEITITKTTDQPYTETTTNYYGAADRVVSVNGQQIKMPAITSETVTAGVNQTTTRSDAPGIELKLTDYSRTVVKYADGTSKTDITAASEQIYDKNEGTVSTEFNINETVLTDFNNNTFTNRYAERSEVRDAKTNELVQIAQDIFTYTSVIDEIKTVNREIGTTKAFETYVEDGVEKTLMTVSSHSSSTDVYENGQLISSKSDTGDFMVITDAEMEYDNNGLAIGAKVTDNSRVIRSGREVNEETYSYKDENGNTTDQPVSVEYERTNYDYIDMSVTKNEGIKKNGYNEETGELTSTEDRYTSKTYGLNSDLTSYDPSNLRKAEEGYIKEYDIVNTTNSDGSTTRTSKSESYSKASNYVTGEHTVTTNTNVETSITVDADGNIIDKKVSGELRTWVYDNEDLLNAVNLDDVINAGDKYSGGQGVLDDKHSYSYVNTNYTYDHFGRETGYDFQRTYFKDGREEKGRNTTAYTELAGDFIYSEALGIMVPSVITFSSSASVTDDGRVIDSSEGYYGNNSLGNTSLYKSMESTDFKQVQLNNIATEVFGDAMLRKGFAGIATAEMNDNIRIAVVAATIAVAVVFTVATGGLGLAAFVPALAAGVSMSAGAIAVSAALTAFLAASAMNNAVIAFQQEGVSATALLNLGAAILTIAFPVRIGGGAAGLANTAAQTVNTTAKVASGLSKIFTVANTTRMAIATVATAVDIIQTQTKAGDNDGFLINLARSLSLAGFVGMGTNVSEDSFFGKSVFGGFLPGFKWSHLTFGVGYIIAPGMISQAVSGTLVQTLKNIGTGILKAPKNAVIGVNKVWHSGLSLIGRGNTFANLGALANASALSKAIYTWSNITQHMHRMTSLQIGMNVAGKIFNPLITKMGDSTVKDIASFVFGEMGQSDNIFEVNMGFSFAFGTIMHVAMPFFSQIAKGFTTQTASATQSSAAAAGTSKGSQFLNNAKGKLSELANSIYEEGLKENIIQHLAAPFVGTNAAEFVSEFLSPGGGGSISTFANNVNTAEFTGAESMTNAGNAVNEHFANTGTNYVVTTTYDAASNTGQMHINNSLSDAAISQMLSNSNIKVGAGGVQVNNGVVTASADVSPAAIQNALQNALGENYQITPVAGAANQIQVGLTNSVSATFTVNSVESLKNAMMALGAFASNTNQSISSAKSLQEVLNNELQVINQLQQTSSFVERRLSYWYALTQGIDVDITTDVQMQIAPLMSNFMDANGKLSLKTATLDYGNIDSYIANMINLEMLLKTMPAVANMMGVKHADISQEISDAISNIDYAEFFNAAKTEIISANENQNEEKQKQDVENQNNINALTNTDILSQYLGAYAAIKSVNGSDAVLKGLSERINEVVDKVVESFNNGEINGTELFAYEQFLKLAKTFSVLQAQKSGIKAGEIAINVENIDHMHEELQRQQKELLSDFNEIAAENIFGEDLGNGMYSVTVYEYTDTEGKVERINKQEADKRIAAGEEGKIKTETIEMTLEEMINHSMNAMCGYISAMEKYDYAKTFLQGQADAIRHFSEKYAQAQSKGERLKIVEELRTGGGKTLISVYAAALLACTDTSGKAVTVLTNNQDNARELFEAIEGIMGDGKIVGSVNHLTAGQTDAQQQEILKSAKIIVSDYSTFSGIVAADWSTLVANGPILDLLSKAGVEFDSSSGALKAVKPEMSSKAMELLIAANNGTLNAETINQIFAGNNFTSAQIEAIIAAAHLAASDGKLSDALKNLKMPLERIGSVVADEIDYFATIPSQALASSNGKFYGAKTVSEFYTEAAGLHRLANTEGYSKALEEFKAKYTDLGISNERIEAVVNTQDAATFEEYSKMYEEIAAEVDKSKGMTQDAIQRLSNKYADLLSATYGGNGGINLAADIQMFIANAQGVEYFREIAEVTKPIFEAFRAKAYEDIKMGTGQVYEVEAIEGESVTRMPIRSIFDTIINRISGADNVAAQEIDKQARKDIKRSSEAKAELVKMIKAQDAKSKVNKATITQQQAVEAAVKELMKDYPGMYTEAEVRMHVMNGIGAYAYTEGVEFGLRNAVYNEAGELISSDRVVITNTGVEVENLSQPAGMMQVLEVINNAQNISKPNTDNYTSTAVFAMSLFSNVVGLTGTISGLTNNLFDSMGIEVNENAQRFASDSVLLKTQKGTELFTIEAAQELENSGKASFNLLLTANTAATNSWVDTLNQAMTERLKEIGIEGLDADAVIKMLTDETSAAKVKGGVSNTAELIEQWKSDRSKLKGDLQEKYNLSDSQVQELTSIMSNTYSTAVQTMTPQELAAIANNIKSSGMYRFAIGDAYLLGRGWDLGNMRGTASHINANQPIMQESGSITTIDSINSAHEATVASINSNENLDSVAKAQLIAESEFLTKSRLKALESAINTNKVVANCYLMEAELMTEGQMRQAGGRIDPFSSNRFDAEFYDKAIISLYSVENARTVESLNSKVVEQGGVWSIESIIQNLDDIQRANEVDAFNRAGQNVETSKTELIDNISAIESQMSSELAGTVKSELNNANNPYMSNGSLTYEGKVFLSAVAAFNGIEYKNKYFSDDKDREKLMQLLFGIYPNATDSVMLAKEISKSGLDLGNLFELAPVADKLGSITDEKSLASVLSVQEPQGFRENLSVEVPSAVVINALRTVQDDESIRDIVAGYDDLLEAFKLVSPNSRSTFSEKHEALAAAIEGIASGTVGYVSGMARFLMLAPVRYFFTAVFGVSSQAANSFTSAIASSTGSMAAMGATEIVTKPFVKERTQKGSESVGKGILNTLDNLTLLKDSVAFKNAQKKFQNIIMKSDLVKNTTEINVQDVKGTYTSELFGEKMGSLVVNGLTEPKEIDKGLMYVLNIWSDAESMAERLDVKLSELGTADGENKINEGYVKATMEVYDALMNKELSVGEAEVEIMLLGTIRDLLIMVNNAGDKKDSMIEMLSDQDLTKKKVDIIKAELSASKKQNSKNAKNLLEEKLEPLAEAKAKELGEAIKEVKKEIEKEDKVITSVKEKLIALATGDKKMIENILPSLGSDTWVDRGARGKMMSPMMTRALAASA